MVSFGKIKQAQVWLACRQPQAPSILLCGTAEGQYKSLAIVEQSG
jgi:hypothetical protein